MLSQKKKYSDLFKNILDICGFTWYSLENKATVR